MKRMVIIIIMACFIAALSIQGAMAAVWFPNATMNQVGIGSGTVYIVLTDPAVNVSQRWYVADSSNQNAILAIALTAVANGQNVKASVSTSDQFGTVTALYLSPSQ
jgi:hypothetical protein